MTNEFHLSEVSDEALFETCLSLYVERQEEFHNAATLFNAWYACLIDIRQATRQETGGHLDTKLPKDYVSISLSAVNAHYDLEQIKTTFPNATEVKNERLEQKITDFQNSDRGKIFRGKYELHFLTTFIELLLQDAKTSKRFLSKKANFAFGDKLSNEQALNVFQTYAETPPQLNEYLEKVTT